MARRAAAGLAAAAFALAGCGGGGPAFDGDPFDTLVAATAETLQLPLAYELTFDIDLDRVAELARASGDPDAAAGMAMFGSGEVRTVTTVLLSADAAEARVEVDGNEFAALRMDDGELPMVRLQTDALGSSLPMLSFARGMAPELFTGEWVELTGDTPIEFGDIEEGLAEARAEMAEVDRQEAEADTDFTHVEDDEDGWRFRITAAEGADDDVPDEAAFDVWVQDDVINRLRMDFSPFLAMEVPELEGEDLDDLLVFDVRRSSDTLSSRPTPESSYDVNQLGGF